MIRRLKVPVLSCHRGTGESGSRIWSGTTAWTESPKGPLCWSSWRLSPGLWRRQRGPYSVRCTSPAAGVQTRSCWWCCVLDGIHNGLPAGLPPKCLLCDDWRWPEPGSFQWRTGERCSGNCHSRSYCPCPWTRRRMWHSWILWAHPLLPRCWRGVSGVLRGPLDRLTWRSLQESRPSQGIFPSWPVWLLSKLHLSYGGGQGWWSRASVGSGRAQWGSQWRVCWAGYWSVPSTLRWFCSSP